MNKGCQDALAGLERVRQASVMAKQLLQAGGVPRTPCVLAPWDEATYFDAPLVTDTVVPQQTIVMLVGANPRRTSLLIGCDGTTPAATFVSPDQTILGPTSGGLQISALQAPLTLTQKDHGPLVQSAWFVYSFANGVNVVTVEVLLNQWPSHSSLPQRPQPSPRTPIVVEVGSTTEPIQPDLSQQTPSTPETPAQPTAPSTPALSNTGPTILGYTGDMTTDEYDALLQLHPEAETSVTGAVYIPATQTTTE